MRRALSLSAFAFLFFAANIAAQTLKTAPASPAAAWSATASPSPAALQAARVSYAKLPLAFEENAGQTDARVKYTSRGQGYNLFLTADEAVFVFRGAGSSPDCARRAPAAALGCAGSSQAYPLWMKMVGANPSASIASSDVLPGKINYYVGNDPRKWRTGVSQYGRVTYQDIYPGVDVAYYGNQEQLESDYIVKPGASPKAIEFELTGARGIRLDDRGDLLIETGAGEVRLLRPGVYQMVDGAKREVSGRYVLRGKNRVGFEVGSYNKRDALVIDPVLVYSTLLGGSALSFGGDSATGITIDSTGHAYVTGSGTSADFPVTTGTPGDVSPSISLGYAFVTEFDPNGNTLVYSTILRGTQNFGFGTSGAGIGVDGTGNAYVDGITGDPDFPLLNPFQATIGEDPVQLVPGSVQSGFVAGLNSSGTLVYSTFFGGRNNGDLNYLTGLAADAAGNAYVVGYTDSQNFPMVNPFQAANNASVGNENVVVAKFNPQGQPIYSTYLGGSGPDHGNAITADTAGNAYITGQTASNGTTGTGFPVQTTPAPFQATLNGFSTNLFVSKLSFSTSTSTLSLANSTYLGGTGTDEGFGIAVDSSGNVYLTGQTSSTLTGTGQIPFPTLSPIPGSGPNCLITTTACTEAFVTKLNSTFSGIVHSTFLGGQGTDTGYGIALDGANPPNVFVTGTTMSTNFPLLLPLQSALMSGTGNVFVTEVNGAGSALTYSTYLGGHGTDVPKGIAVDSGGNAYITGSTTSANFPVLATTGQPYQTQLASTLGNAFVAKLSSAGAAATLNFFPPAFNFGDETVGSNTLTETVTLTNNSAASAALTGVSITGADPSDFAIVSGPGTTCIGGTTTLTTTGATASCIITVQFAPQQQDARTATLTVNYGASSTVTMNLSGSGGAPQISLNPSTVSFGTNVPLNIAAFAGLTVGNPGGGTLNVGSVQIENANAPVFKIFSNSCTTVAPFGSCFIDVQIIATAAQAYTANLVLVDNASGSPHTVPITATAVAQVNVFPPTFEFGGWLLGTTSIDTSAAGLRGISVDPITVQNGSGSAITLTGISATGNASDFPTDPTPPATGLQSCATNLVLLPGVSCAYDVYFAPQAASGIDGRTATYTFTWTGGPSGSSPKSANVVGAGETGVTLYSNSYTAPSEYVGAIEHQAGFDLIFNGTSNPVLVTSIVLSGANPQDFHVELENACSTNFVLPANSVCYLDGSFSPSQVGARSATVTINYTIQSATPTSGSLTLNVTGTGLAGPVNFTGTFDFGGVIDGVTSPAQTFYLNNLGKGAVTISGITLPADSEFAQVNATAQGACKSGGVVPGGGNCFFEFTFTPSGTGAHSTTLTVTDNGPGSPRTLTMNGTGVPGSEYIVVTPNSLDFGNVVFQKLTTQPTVSATFYLTNAGSQPTTITTQAALTSPAPSVPPAPPTTPYNISTAPTVGTCLASPKVLPQGGNCAVVVTLTPTATGVVTNVVTITDSLGGTHSVPVTANVVNQGAVSLSPSTLSFTAVKGGSAPPAQTVTLTNTGTGPVVVTVMAIDGPNASDFAINSTGTTCVPGTTGFTVPAGTTGNTCTMAISFNPPATVGTYSADLLISATEGNNALYSGTVPLTGSVTSAPLTATPSPINFGTAALGMTLDFTTINNFSEISLTNNTGSNITITSIALQTTPSDFAISAGSSCLGFPVSPNFNCFFDMTFAPTTAALESNNVLVSYTIPGIAGTQQLSIPVNGTGTNMLSANPNPVNFSAVAGTPTSANVTLGNGSTSTLTITNIGAISGSSQYSLGLDSCTGFPLSAGGSCFVPVNLAANALGTGVAGSFVVTYNINGGTPQTLTVNLSANITAPQVTLSYMNQATNPANTVVFPVEGITTQGINTRSLLQVVVITNSGTAPLTFSFPQAKITGTNSNDFSFAEGNVYGTQGVGTPGCEFVGTLPPGKSCSIPIAFTPGPAPLPGGATRTAVLTISDNAFPSGTQTLTLEGNTTGVSTSTNSLNFPDTNVGLSSTLSAVVTNQGSSAVTFSGVTFGTTSYSLDTSQTLNACSTTIPASPGSCVVYIKFTPQAAGANLDTATIHTSVGSPTIALSGNGKATAVTISPTTITFSGLQLVNTQSSPQPATLTNGTASAITISNVQFTGDFLAGTNTCTGSIPAGGNCTVNVIFKPTATGARTGTLVITETGTPTSVTVNLSGTGTQPATIAATSGATQSVVVNTAFATLQATVKDSNSNVLPGVSVTFTVTAAGNGASGTFAGSVTSATVTTDANGIATAPTFTANNIPGGPYTVAAMTGTVGPANFSLTNLAGTPASITATSGTPQSVAINTAFAALQVTVKDAGSLPLDGVTVTFNAPSTGASGTFTGGTNGGLTATAVTNTSGVATAPTFTANGTSGGPYNVTATAGALAPANFSLTNLAGAPSKITATAGTPQSAVISTAFTTALAAKVTDSGGNPINGATVTFTAPSTGASGTFTGGTNGGTTITATTNASGVATAATFTANGTVGGYTVNAAVAGVSTPAPFSLNNTAGPPSKIATSAGTPQSAAVTAAFTTNLAALVTDSGGNPVSGVTVTFNAPSTGASGSFTGGTNGGLTVTANTGANGIATATTFTANSTIGSYTVTASAAGVAGTVSFSLTNTAGPPASITATAGTPQSAAISAAFTTNLAATVKDAGGNPVNGATVTFTAPSSGASGTFTGGTSGGTVVTALTNSSGVATAAVFTANTVAGAYSVTASVSGVTTKATFSLTNNAGAPASITATAGTPQSATISTAFTTALGATVKDGSGNLVPGATVTFTAPSTGASGTFAGGTSGGTVVTAVTNSSGIATASVFTANTVSGAYSVTASVSGVTTKATFSLTNNAGAPASITATAGTPQSATISTAFTTALAATVKDGSGNLVPGATVTFTAPSTGASGTFAGGTSGGTVVTAVTNASGVATASAFTANKIAGSYTVSASASGVVTTASFSLTNNAGPAANIAASSGTPQSTAINTAFASLQATVTDGSGNPVSGVSVTFTAPSTGASGAFAAPGTGATATVTTGANGVATAPTFTANSTAGAYTVAAKAGTIGPANFSLTNLSAPPASIAATAGSGQSAQITKAFATALQATVEDKNNLPIAGVTVTFTAPSTGPSGTFTGGTSGGLVATAVTNSSGVATAPTFTANSTAGGPYNVQASAGTGTVVTVNFSLTNLPGPPASITATAGTPQSVTIGGAYATLQATVKDSGGNLLSGVTVTFTAPSTGASGTFAGGTNGGATVAATTNASGVASASTFTANTTAGAFSVTAAVSGVTSTASFSLKNLAGPPSKMIISGGGSQSVAVNTAFAALGVTVTDASGNGVSGVSVTFTAPSSGPSGTFAAPGTGATASITTNTSGVATAPAFTANNSVGGPYLVSASASGLTSVNFSLTNLAGTPASITASSGTPQSVAISTAFATLVATVKDNKSNPLMGVVVTFTAPASGPSGTFTSGQTTATATTDVNGNATAPTFTANGTAGGPYNVAATAGAVGPANFALTNLSGPPASVTATAGATQSAVINAAFTTNLGVTVKDSGGNLLSGVVVTFTAPSSGASGKFTGGTNGGLTATATTGANGVATAPVFTANATVGAYTVNATVTGVSTPAAFSLNNTPGPPTSITATAGTPQSATINAKFTTALQTTVTDSGGNPISGLTVTFTAPSSGASGTFASPGTGATATATTNASGIATAPAFTANSTAGAYNVNASVSGVTTKAGFALTNNPGPPASISATAGTPQSAPVSVVFTTNLQATVKDSGGNPVSNATVTFTAPSSGASGTFTGGSATAQAKTDVNGNAVAPTFTANAIGGSYGVTASVTGVSTPAAFALTNTVAPDVTISKSHPAGDFTIGTNGTYTIVLKNNGTGPTTGNVTVTDALPTGLTFVSGTNTGGWSCSASGQNVTCTNATVGLLAAKGGSSTITLTVSVGPNAISSPTNFTVTNSATVADPGDSGTTDKTATDAPTNIDNVVPALSSFSPNLGLIAGATSAQQITLTGTGFNASTQVNFGSTVLTGGTASADGTSLTISVPVANLATAGSVKVTVTNPKNPATNLGGGTSTASQSVPLVALAALAPNMGTPNPVPIVAGTPYMLQMNLSLSPSGAALPGDVTITCSFPTTETGAKCTPTPGTIQHGSSTAPTLGTSITITATPTAKTGSTAPRGPRSAPPYLPWLIAGLMLSMLGMLWAARQRMPQLRRVPAYLALLVLTIGAGALVGCTSSPAGPTPTPTGPSTLTVTATAADGATVTATVPITVSN